jgi:hypothetical protein
MSKRKYPLTIKEAKEVCKSLIGRLPHCGCEVSVKKWETEELIVWDTPTYKASVPMKVDNELWLQNIAGTYRLNETRISHLK